MTTATAVRACRKRASRPSSCSFVWLVWTSLDSNEQPLHTNTTDVRMKLILLFFVSSPTKNTHTHNRSNPVNIITIYFHESPAVTLLQVNRCTNSKYTYICDKNYKAKSAILTMRCSKTTPETHILVLASQPGQQLFLYCFCNKVFFVRFLFVFRNKTKNILNKCVEHDKTTRHLFFV